MEMTITEALAEIKLVEKKATTKMAFVRGNLVRAKHVTEAQGGVSRETVAAEVQAISDLQKRLVAIRTGIAKANLETNIIIGERSNNIHGWLSWKREVAEKELSFYKDVFMTVKREMEDSVKNPRCWKDDKGEPHIVEFVTNLSYEEYAKKAEVAQDLLEKLDGQLSLKNATTVIKI